MREIITRIDNRDDNFFDGNYYLLNRITCFDMPCSVHIENSPFTSNTFWLRISFFDPIRLTMVQEFLQYIEIND